jgi:hypothetical protein
VVETAWLLLTIHRLCTHISPLPNRNFVKKEGFHEILNLSQLISYNEYFFQKPRQESQNKTNLQHIMLQGLRPAAVAFPTGYAWTVVCPGAFSVDWN